MIAMAVPALILDGSTLSGASCIELQAARYRKPELQSAHFLLL
jgi:hypothetical protein